MIIGNNTLLGTVAAFNLTNTKKLFGTTQEAVLTANQRLIAVHVGWAPGNHTASGTIKACLYDQGNAAANKPMIAGTEISIPFNSATLGASPRWVSVTGLSVDLSAHAGKTLCPGLAPPAAGANSGFSVLLGTVSGATRANATVTQSSNPDPFISASTTANQAWSIYFETETIGSSTTIDTVNGSSSTPTIIFGQSNTIATTGIATLTSATIATSGAGSTNNITLNAPGGDGIFTPVWPPTDGATFPSFGGILLTVSDGTGSANIAGTIQLPSGWASVTFSNPIKNNPRYLGYHYNLTNKKCYYPTANGLVIDTDGRLRCNASSAPLTSDIHFHSSVTPWAIETKTLVLTELNNINYLGQGLLNLAGSLILKISKRISGLGSLNISGSGLSKKISKFQGSGDVMLSGSASIIFSSNNDYRGEGTLLIKGSSIIKITKRYIGSGLFNLIGTALINQNNYIPSEIRTVKIKSSFRKIIGR